MSPAVPYRLYNDFIRHGIDDRELYRCAAAEVTEPGLQVVLHESADSLNAMIGELQLQVRCSGHVPARHGTPFGALRRWTLAHWDQLRAGQHDRRWIHRLLRSEGALLKLIERRIPCVTPDAAQILRRQLSRLHGIHLDMHSLERSPR
ncbi:MAG: hypothetical protein ABW154_04195 [Dyella sp.]